MMTPHIPTLVMVVVFVSAVLGTLLLFAWLQDRSVRSLLWWGATCLLTALGMALLAARGHIPDFLSIGVANAALFLAAGTMWSGARLFARRDLRLRWVVIPPLLWIPLSLTPPLSDDVRTRIVVFSLVLALFVFATAHTFWRGRDEPLVSRWAVIAVLVIHGTMHLGRVPGTYLLSLPPESALMHSGYFGFMAMTLLLFMLAFAFTLLALTKERAELHHKRVACVDPLTGLLNRRALFQAYERMSDEAAPASAMAVLVFDLDRFKQINDRFGHPVGDRVLQLFAMVTRLELRSCDVLGRVGGEEFAAFLPGCGVEQATRVGERVRQRFAAAACEVGLPDFRPTVSVGVAVAESGIDSTALLVAADRAVYRAKEAGRDCVRLAEPRIKGAAPAVPSAAALQTAVATQVAA